MREAMEERVKGKKRAGKPRKVMISGLEEALVRKRTKKVIQRKYRIRGREKE